MSKPTGHDPASTHRTAPSTPPSADRKSCSEPVGNSARVVPRRPAQASRARVGGGVLEGPYQGRRYTNQHTPPARPPRGPLAHLVPADRARAGYGPPGGACAGPPTHSDRPPMPLPFTLMARVRRGSAWRAPHEDALAGPKGRRSACVDRHNWSDWNEWATGNKSWRECGRCGLVEDHTGPLPPPWEAREGSPGRRRRR